MRHAKLNLIALRLQPGRIHELFHARAPPFTHGTGLSACLFSILLVRSGTASAAHASHDTRGLLLQLFFSFLDLFLLLLKNFQELLPLDFVSLLLANGGLFWFRYWLAILAEYSCFPATKRVKHILVTSQLAKITCSSYYTDRLLMWPTVSSLRVIVLLSQVRHLLTASHLVQIGRLILLALLLFLKLVNQLVIVAVVIRLVLQILVWALVSSPLLARQSRLLPLTLRCAPAVFADVVFDRLRLLGVRRL